MKNSASPSSGAFCIPEVRMGEVVQLRDYQRKEEPKPEQDGEVIYCSPPIKDTAPSEYNAQDGGDCA